MGDSNEIVASSQSLTLDLPPSCIEFCLAHPKHFVVGTYNLIKDEQPTAEVAQDTDSSAAKKPQNRNGSLVVFQFEKGKVRLVQTVSHPSAILDLHFCPAFDKCDILAAVSSTGSLSIFRLDPNLYASEPLKHLATSRISDVYEGVLFLSGVWSSHDPALIALTTSTGEVRMVRLDDSWNIINDNGGTVIQHSLEAWTVAFSPRKEGGDEEAEANCPFVVYSGGDDSALRYASFVDNKAREDGSESALSKLCPPLKIDGHGAGVTAILPVSIKLADGSMVVVTGSYDDTIRVFAIQPPHETYGIRKFKRLAEANLGGGVWRLKLIDLWEKNGLCCLRVLASCMHAGVRLVELKGLLDGEDWDVNVLACFEEHKSMNYGSDISPNSADGRLLIVSTSFYDKLLCLWETTLLSEQEDAA